jgi:hypothetical protein
VGTREPDDDGVGPVRLGTPAMASTIAGMSRRDLRRRHGGKRLDDVARDEPAPEWKEDVLAKLDPEAIVDPAMPAARRVRYRLERVRIHAGEARVNQARRAQAHRIGRVSRVERLRVAGDDHFDGTDAILASAPPHVQADKHATAPSTSASQPACPDLSMPLHGPRRLRRRRSPKPNGPTDFPAPRPLYRVPPRSWFLSPEGSAGRVAGWGCHRDVIRTRAAGGRRGGRVRASSWRGQRRHRDRRRGFGAMARSRQRAPRAQSCVQRQAIHGGRGSCDSPRRAPLRDDALRQARRATRSSGSLGLRGFGDPSLKTADLWAMVQELKGYGVKRVEGDIVVDQRVLRRADDPPAFEQQPNEWAAFRAPVSAVALDENCVTLTVRPSDRWSRGARRVRPRRGSSTSMGACARRMQGQPTTWSSSSRGAACE